MWSVNPAVGIQTREDSSCVDYRKGFNKKREEKRRTLQSYGLTKTIINISWNVTKNIKDLPDWILMPDSKT